MNINTAKLTIESKTKWVTKFKIFAKKLGFKWIPNKLKFPLFRNILENYFT